MLETLWDILLDTLLDGAKLLPFLFLAYLFIEWLELRASDRFEHGLQKAGRFGPLIGALLGCVPQCGFSVAAANLYAGGVATLGTLIAVFLSTSDEAVLILMAYPDRIGELLGLLGCKVVIGVIFGFLVDLIWKKKPDAEVEHEAICAHCGCQQQGVFRSALRHTLKTLLFILLVIFVLSCLIEWIGMDAIRSFMMADSVFQPFLAALFGFIPNCAASVLITELYLEGALSFGATVAGLCTGAGVGLAVLWQMHRNWKQNLAIMGILYVAAVLSGVVLTLIL